MRHGALKHIAKDFEVRGLEVFQVVQQMWFILVGETTGQVLDTVSTGVESTSGHLFLSLTSLFRPPLSICDVWLIFHSISTLYLCGGHLFLSLTSFFCPPLSICDVWSIEDNFCLAVDDGACVKATNSSWQNTKQTFIHLLFVIFLFISGCLLSCCENAGE